MHTYQFVAFRGPNRWSPFPMLEVLCRDRLDSNASEIAKQISAKQILTVLAKFLEAKQFTASHPQSVSNATRIVASMDQIKSDTELWLACARWFSALAGVPTRDLD
ncbi:MAG: hypothetical protein K9M08_13395, partial [Pirellula sp.]|nr:hypothetical protein [Pirellula sp.]